MSELRQSVSFPAYRVGDGGSVWSGNRPLRTFLTGRPPGYHAVGLRRNGRRWRVYVHHLVAEAFIGRRPLGMDCCHNDGDRDNNRPDNLRYDTRSGNLADRDRHGTHQRGERNPAAKLTNAQASEIKTLRAAGAPLKEIAARFDVHESTVSRIANGIRRKGVEDA